MNDFYTSPVDQAPFTKVRAVDLNNIDAAVDAAFDKLPSPTALKTGTVNYAVDTGNVDNAYLVALSAGLIGYTDGLEVRMRPTRSNTGPSTINVNGLGAIAIKRNDGTDLVAGDIVTNAAVRVSYVASSNAFVMSSTAGSQIQGLQDAVTAAAGSATAAAGSASTANTKAGQAANSAAAAANSATAAQDAANAAATSNAQVQADWAVSDTNSKAFIKNKTSILSMLLAGLSTASSAAVTVADSILSAVGKLQRQITDLGSIVGAKVQLGSTNQSFGTTLANGIVPSIATISSSGNDASIPLTISNGSNNFASAVIQFFRGGSFAGFFGLDVDNKLKWGGSSMGAVSYEIFHQGNLSPMPTGGGNFTGPTIYNNAVGIYMKDSSGVAKQAIGVSNANDVQLVNIGGSNWQIYNKAINTIILNVSDAGVLSAPVVIQTSDENEKENWRAAKPTLVDEFAEIKYAGVFDWKKDGESSCSVGAQSLQKMLPEAVHVLPNNTLGINAGGAALVILHQMANRLIAAEKEIKQLKGY